MGVFPIPAPAFPSDQTPVQDALRTPLLRERSWATRPNEG
jgi:hypothetical protein